MAMKDATSEIVLYPDTARELNATVRTVYGYCRRGILNRAMLPGFTRARGVTRQSLNKLLEAISSGGDPNIPASHEGAR